MGSAFRGSCPQHSNVHPWFASLKPKSTTHNELAQGIYKSPIIFDYSHCRFSGLLCSDPRGFFETPHTYRGARLPTLASKADQRANAKKLPGTEKQSKILPPCFPPSLSSSTQQLCGAGTFTTHMHAGFLGDVRRVRPYFVLKRFP